MSLNGVLACLAAVLVLPACSSSGENAPGQQPSSVVSSGVQTVPSVAPDSVTVIGDVLAEINLPALYQQEDPQGGSPCQAADGYDDIATGADVVVTDSAGATIALGRLQPGGLKAASPGSMDGWCAFHFEVPNVPGNQQFYGLTIGQRDPMTLSRAELTERLSLELGESQVPRMPS